MTIKKQKDAIKDVIEDLQKMGFSKSFFKEFSIKEINFFYLPLKHWKKRGSVLLHNYIANCIIFEFEENKINPYEEIEKLIDVNVKIVRSKERHEANLRAQGFEPVEKTEVPNWLI